MQSLKKYWGFIQSFLGILIKESSWECYCVLLLWISIFIYFIYVPISKYLLFVGAVDCFPKYMAFSHILGCMLNWNRLLQGCFYGKKKFTIHSLHHIFKCALLQILIRVTYSLIIIQNVRIIYTASHSYGYWNVPISKTAQMFWWLYRSSLQ